MLRPKYIWSLLLLFLLPLLSMAQGSLTVQAPHSVPMEQNFKIQFIIKGGPGVDFRAPSMLDFEVIYDKAISKNEKEGIITYTYTLRPKKEGRFTIGEAKIRIGDNTFSSKAIRIDVLPADKINETGSTQAASTIDASTLFIKPILSKTRVYEQEAILVSYKLYTLHPSIQFEQVKFPEYTDFIAQDIEDDQNKQLRLERYQGKNYQSVILKQTLLFPQKSGKLSIPSGRFDVLVYIQDKTSKPDEIFAGKANYTKVRRSINTPAIPVESMPLPSPKPKGFEGSVGKYSLNASILESSELKSNESITLKVEINGSGNFKLLGNPSIKFPDSFEQYEPKTDSKILVSSSGVIGSRSIEYTLIPRMSGNFEIPPISINYFDPQTREYKQTSSKAITLKIKKGESESAAIGGMNVDNASKNGLMPLKSTSRSKVSPFLKSSLYLHLSILTISILAILSFFVLRARIRSLQDVEGTKARKAKNKAKDRLSKVKEYRETKSELFNDELLLVLRTFLSDKFGIHSSQLSKSKLEEMLSTEHLTTTSIQKLSILLEELEFNRFAGQEIDEAKQLRQLNDAIELIEEIDNKITLKS